MAFDYGRLVRLSEAGQCYYLWVWQEDGWYWDKEMWCSTPGETEDDFYRDRDMEDQFDIEEERRDMDQRRSVDWVLEAMDWDAFYALPDSEEAGW